MSHELVGIIDQKTQTAHMEAGRSQVQEEAAHGVLCGCFSCGQKAQQIAGNDVPTREQAREILGLSKPQQPKRSEDQMRAMINFDGDGEVNEPTELEKAQFERRYIANKYGIGESAQVDISGECTPWRTVDPEKLDEPVKKYAKTALNGLVIVPDKIAQLHQVETALTAVPTVQPSVLETYYNPAKIAKEGTIFTAEPIEEV